VRGILQMNDDFTKEELECLISNHWECGANHPGLYDKIKSMIDNYKCDHESDGFCYTSYPPQNRCKKCGDFYR